MADVRLPTATLSRAPGGCAAPGAERRGPPWPAASPSHKLSLPRWRGPGAAVARFPFAPPWLLGCVRMSAPRRAGGPGTRVRRAESAFCRSDAGAWTPPLPWAWGHSELGAARVTTVARSETPAGGHHRPGLDPCGFTCSARSPGSGEPWSWGPCADGETEALVWPLPLTWGPSPELVRGRAQVPVVVLLPRPCCPPARTPLPRALFYLLGDRCTCWPWCPEDASPGAVS